MNRKDPAGRNVFEGGFLGLDNIGVFDRSATLPTGGRLEQADGTAWMAMFSQNMLELALVLLDDDRPTRSSCSSSSSTSSGSRRPWTRWASNPDEMWDEEDGFFYDVLRLPDGTGTRIKVRSLVGLLPLCATTVIEPDVIERYPQFAARVAAFLERNEDLLANIADPLVPGVSGRRMLSLVNEDKLRRILARMLDEERFLGPHGIRSVSRWHLDHPYVFDVDGAEHRVQYEPAESTSAMFGGNSNWRGPVWFPINLLLIRALSPALPLLRRRPQGRVPDRLGTMMTLLEVAQELAAAPRRHLPARQRRAPPGLRRDQAVPGGPALARPHPLLRVLPRRQRRRPRRLASDRLDRAGGHADPGAAVSSTPSPCLRTGSGRWRGRTGARRTRNADPRQQPDRGAVLLPRKAAIGEGGYCPPGTWSLTSS